jgi:vacuolar-type H+-ATPase subunit F/Vma7
MGMGRIAVLAAGLPVRGFALTGALVLPAEEPDTVRAAWRDLPDDVDVVILTMAAATVLGAAVTTVRRPLTAVLPV